MLNLKPVFQPPFAIFKGDIEDLGVLRREISERLASNSNRQAHIERKIGFAFFRFPCQERQAFRQEFVNKALQRGMVGGHEDRGLACGVG